MVFTVKHAAPRTGRRLEFWTWWLQNGFLETQVAAPIIVDTDQATVTVTHWLPVSQPGDPDFPELRRDESGQPLVETRVWPLLVDPPDWLIPHAWPPLAA